MFVVSARPRGLGEVKKTPLERQLERDRAESERYDREQQTWRNGEADDDNEPIRLLMRAAGRST